MILKRLQIGGWGLIAFIAGCAHQPLPPSNTHLSQSDHNIEQAVPKSGNGIPAPLTDLPPFAPAQTKTPDYFTLVVSGVPVEEVLFALARDANLDVDIRADVSGGITLNVIDQPLDLILGRIATLAGLRIRHQAGRLIVEADLPYFHTYRIDYINMDRAVTHRVAVSTQIATSGSSELASGSGGGGNNNSSTELTGEANNNFWEQLIDNVTQMVASSSVEGMETESTNNVIANRIASLLTVNATEIQHQQVEAYLGTLLSAAHRQVLIEATIAEITLSRDYQAGVDWSIFGNRGWSAVSANTGTNLADVPLSALAYTNTSSALGDINLVIEALQTFGDVKVLSSPKLIAMNNQTALLKVVDERVYFTFEVEREEEEDGSEEITVETTVNTVPVGLVMAVTPYISEDNEVTLNVRPTISRIIGFVQFDDPFVRGANGEATLVSRVPEIQVREIETVLRVNSGQTVVLGGLMQDTIDNSSDGVPLLGDLPYIGDLFKFRHDTSTKSELVIFLRPVVTGSNGINSPPLDRYRQYLPDTSLPLTSQLNPTVEQ